MSSMQQQYENAFNGEYFAHVANWEKTLLQGHLKQTIKDIQLYIELHAHEETLFYGIGNNQQKEGLCLGTEIKWYFAQRRRNEHMDNPYDLLSLLASCQQNAQEIIQWYIKMVSSHPFCYKLHYGLANIYYNTHQISNSQKHYKQAVKINPKFDQGYIGLAWIQTFRYFRYPKAMEYAIVAHKINNSNFSSRLIIGGFHPSFQQSQIILNQLKTDYPNNPIVLSAIGFRGFNQYPVARTKQIYLQAIGMPNKSIVPYIYLSKLYNFQGDTEKAIFYLQQAIKFNSKSYHPYLQLGFLYYHQNDFKKSLSFLQKTFDRNQEESHTLYLGACIYVEEVDPPNYVKGAKLLRQCIFVNPYYMQAYPKLRQIYKFQDKEEQYYNSMVEQFNIRLQTADKKDAYETTMLALQILQAKQFKNIDQIYNLIQNNQMKEILSLGIGEKLLLEGYALQSIKFIQNAVEDADRKYQSYLLLGKAYQAIGKELESLKYYTLLLQQQLFQEYLQRKEIQYIFNNFLLIIYKLKQDQSTKWLQKIIPICSKNIEFNILLGKYYQKLNKFEEALNTYHNIQNCDLSYNFKNEEEVDNFYGLSKQKWQKLNRKGIYPRKDQIQFSKIKIQYQMAFYQLLSTSK